MIRPMQSTLVWRIEALPEAALSSRLKHIRGTQRSPVTRDYDKRGMDLCEMAHGVKFGVKLIGKRTQTTAAQRRKLREEAADLVAGQRGKKPEPWCELVVVGGKVIDWHPDKAVLWAKTVMRDIRRLMPDAVTIQAAIHGDETEWHMHVAMQPRARDSTGRMRLGQTAMRRGMDAILQGGAVKDRIDKNARRRGSSALLSHLHDTIGKPFGLLRGKEDSRREHKEIDPYEAVQARWREITRMRERVRAELEAAEKEREEVASLKRRYKAIEIAEAELEAKAKREQAAMRKRAAAAAKREKQEAERAAATKAALAKERAALEKERAEVKAGAARNAKRAREIILERNEYVHEHNARADRLAERTKAAKERFAKDAKEHREASAELRKREQRLADGLEVIDACLYADVDIEAARDGIYAVMHGHPLGPAVEAARDDRRAMLAADKRRRELKVLDGGIPETDATRELAELAKRGTRPTSV